MKTAENLEGTVLFISCPPAKRKLVQTLLSGTDEFGFWSHEGKSLSLSVLGDSGSNRKGPRPCVRRR